jgi:hypothetical protein
MRERKEGREGKKELGKEGKERGKEEKTGTDKG